MKISEEQLGDYLADALSAEDRAAVDTALAASPALREALALMQELEESPAMALVTPPRSFADRVMQRVLKPKSSFMQLVHSNMFGFSTGQVYGVAGVLAILLIFLTAGGFSNYEAVTNAQKTVSDWVPEANLPLLLAGLSVVMLYLFDRILLRRWFAKQNPNRET